MAVPEEQAGLCVARDKDVSVDTFVVTARDSAIEEPGRTCELEPVFADDDIAAAELTGAQAIAIERIFEAKRQSRFRSAEHTSELQPLMRISYAAFCLNKKTHH